jgi:zinc protease
MQLIHHQHMLHHGMKVIVHPYPRMPRVEVALLYDAGSKDEKEGQWGIAHLCEHLMFTGTERVPDFDGMLSPYGGTNNAWTSKDSTCFLTMGPKELLPLILWMEADRMENISGSLGENAISTEKSVVRNELREQYESQPHGKLLLEQCTSLFGTNHPYGHPVIGRHQDIASFDATEVRSFVGEHYCPARAALIVAGDVQETEAMKFVEAYFNGLPAGLPQKRSAPTFLGQASNPVLKSKSRSSYTTLNIEWLFPPVGSAEEKGACVLAELLGNPRYGRLYKRLELEEALATDVFVDLENHRWASVLTIGAIPNSNEDLPCIMEIIEEEINRLVEEEISESEINWVSRRIQRNWLMGMESLGSRVEILSDWLCHHPNLEGLADYMDSLMEPRKQWIQAAAKRMSTNQPLTTIGEGE